MSDESERVAPLSTINRGPSAACRNAFDTTALALTDMEQPNIAYGRFYVQLGLEESDFVPRRMARTATAGAGPETRAALSAVHVGAATTSERMTSARRASTAELLRTDGVLMRDARDQPRPLHRPADQVWTRTAERSRRRCSPRVVRRRR